LFQGEFFVAQNGKPTEQRHTGFHAYSFGEALDRARKKYEGLAEDRPYIFILAEDQGGLTYTHSGGFEKATVGFPDQGEWVLGGASADGSFEVIVRPKQRVS